MKWLKHIFCLYDFYVLIHSLLMVQLSGSFD